MSENFIDTFGFSEAAFTEDTSEDNKDEMHRLTNVLSEGNDDASSPGSANKRAQGIFESICEQRFTSFPGGFDDDLEENEMKEDEDEDPWADKTKEIRFSDSPQASSPGAKVDKNSTSSPTNINSSDEEENGPENSTSPKKENSMEIDDDDEGKNTFKIVLNHVILTRFLILRMGNVKSQRKFHRSYRVRMRRRNCLFFAATFLAVIFVDFAKNNFENEFHCFRAFQSVQQRVFKPV